MRVYISGPITGTEDYIERFKEEEKLIREEGNIPYNPAAVNSMLPEETTYEEYMKVSLMLMDMCDAVQLLPGWKNSVGANREYGYALGKDKIVFFPRSVVAPRYDTPDKNLTIEGPEHKELEDTVAPPSRAGSQRISKASGQEETKCEGYH